MAKGALTVTVELEDLTALRRILRGDTLYGEPWRDGMLALSSRSGLAAQRGAPVRSGKLQGSIRARVQKSKFPTWIAVRVSARNKSAKRNPYPRYLAFAGKFHHKDWLIKAVGPVWAGAERVLERIGAAIEAKWRKT